MTGNTQKFKAANTLQPSATVAICDVSGSDDPSQINGVADAAWLDTEWAGYSGPNEPVVQFNQRVQTAYAKHDNRLNFIYCDGHAGASYPSQIIWGQFWGIFTPGIFFSTEGARQRSDASISKSAFDSTQWSLTPE
jgi:prepilin-type processing-associated H-X9-DG protein